MLPKLIAVLVLGASLGFLAHSARAQAASPVQANPLQWKCAWPFGVPNRTAADADAAVRMVKSVGFNAFAVGGGTPEFKQAIVQACRKGGVEVYWVLNPVYGEWGWRLEKGVIPPTVDCLQQYDDLAKLNTAATPDDVVYAGPWLCIDRPEVRQFAVEMAKACIRNYSPDGLALDFIGYKNLQGCQCAYSRTQRAAFAKVHPELSPEQAAVQFSLTNITTMYDQIRAASLAENPRIKLMCHVYPPFAPEPIYGNRLAVEYPAQTVSWFFIPHWPMQKVSARCALIKETERKHHDYVTGTAFIGVYDDDKSRKTPQRIHEELQAIKQAGIHGFCIAGDLSFLTDTPQARALSQELGGTLHLSPASQPVSGTQ